MLGEKKTFLEKKRVSLINAGTKFNVPCYSCFTFMMNCCVHKVRKNQGKKLYFRGQLGKVRKSQELLLKFEGSQEASENFYHPCTEFVLLLKLLKNSLDLYYVFKGA